MESFLTFLQLILVSIIGVLLFFRGITMYRKLIYFIFHLIGSAYTVVFLMVYGVLSIILIVFFGNIWVAVACLAAGVLLYEAAKDFYYSLPALFLSLKACIILMFCFYLALFGSTIPWLVFSYISENLSVYLFLLIFFAFMLLMIHLSYKYSWILFSISIAFFASHVFVYVFHNIYIFIFTNNEVEFFFAYYNFYSKFSKEILSALFELDASNTFAGIISLLKHFFFIYLFAVILTPFSMSFQKDYDSTDLEKFVKKSLNKDYPKYPFGQFLFEISILFSFDHQKYLKERKLLKEKSTERPST